MEENQRLSDPNFLYANKYDNLTRNQLREGAEGHPGDIFDSMFERQKHWKNVNSSLTQFYGNIMHKHQLENISKHENNFLQREMMKDVNLNKIVGDRIQQKEIFLEEQAQKKVLDQYHVSLFVNRKWQDIIRKHLMCTKDFRIGKILKRRQGRWS